MASLYLLEIKRSVVGTARKANPAKLINGTKTVTRVAATVKIISTARFALFFFILFGFSKDILK
jgi:hypothetical protein